MISNASNKKIAKNTIFLYIRMLIKMLVSLYTSRIILNTLGIIDYGIYNVVGGIVILFGFIVGPMTISVQRFLSFELGKQQDSNPKINIIFNMALYIHIILAIIIFIIAESIGLSIFQNLQIPEERMNAAMWVFHMSIITSCINILQIPYAGVIISHEKMDAYAYISIFEVILKLGLAFFLLLIENYDKLIIYSILVFIATLLTQSIYPIYCRIRIKSINYMKVWDKQIFKELISFASWSLIGEIAWSSTGQGVNIVLNLFNSPIINAARGIAVQVMTSLNLFVLNFQTAINPQIIKNYANNQTEKVLELTIRGIKLSYFLMYIFSLPFLFNINYILKIWLGNVPEKTEIFCRLAIIGILCETLSNLVTTVVKATGHIKNYQVITSLFLCLNLPLSYFSLKAGLNPESVYFVYIAISLILCIIRISFAKKIIGLTFHTYIKKIFLPITISTISSVTITSIFYSLNNNSNLFPFIHSIICIIISIISIIIFGLSKEEKFFLRKKIPVVNKYLNK